MSFFPLVESILTGIRVDVLAVALTFSVVPITMVAFEKLRSAVIEPEDSSGTDDVFAECAGCHDVFKIDDLDDDRTVPSAMTTGMTSHD